MTIFSLKTIREHYKNHQIIFEHDHLQQYLNNNRGSTASKALACVLPETVDDVKKLLDLAHYHNFSVITQGGNTGHVGGAMPTIWDQRPQILLNMTRMDRLIAFEPTDRCMIVEAGMRLHTAQSITKSSNFMFPLSLASESTCTIGGNLASNAGGNAVLAYGTARDLCLGIEAVLANGDIYNGISKLRKSNLGYNLTHLLVGSEGTLGVITKACLKIFPAVDHETALIEIKDPQMGIDIFNKIHSMLGQQLSACEYISSEAYQLILNHKSNLSIQRFPRPTHWLLIEIDVPQNWTSSMKSMLRNFFWELLHSMADPPLNILPAQNHLQRQHFWRMREILSEVQRIDSLMVNNLKHDIGVPLSQLGSFFERCGNELENALGPIRIIAFGHLGDGNIHYNISAPLGTSPKEFLRHKQQVQEIVYNQVLRHQGTISAEHGIGQLKVDDLQTYLGENYVQYQRKIKKSIDPYNRLNPHKIVRDVC